MPDIRIGLIGAGWMGRAHAVAYRNVPMIFGPDPAMPVLRVVADIDGEAAQSMAESHGFAKRTTDWREVVADPEVDVVDITTPNNAHTEIAIAAADAGKHVYCEKPLAPNAEESAAMVAAAQKAGVVTCVGYNYLKNPVQGLARRMIEAGEIGEITLFRGTFDQDFMADASVPFSWRHDRAIAGTGALGDMASHVLSLARYLVGDIAEVCGVTRTFITERPVAAGGSGHGARSAQGGAMRRVENDDVAQFMVGFRNGAVGSVEASRIGTGRKLWLTYEIQGTMGALYFTQERMNELQLYRQTDPPSERGYKTIYAGPEHPGYAGFHPIAGIGLGYNDQKIIEARDLIVAIALGRSAHPDFAFGHKITLVLDAVARSAAERRWVSIEGT